MLVGIVWILFATLQEVGGLTAANEALAALDPTLLSVWGRDLAYEGQWGIVLGALLIFSIGYMGWPHVVTRHMAMRNPFHARRAGVYSTLWNLVFVSAPYILARWRFWCCRISMTQNRPSSPWHRTCCQRPSSAS